MRKQEKAANGKISVHAIAGTYVVLLGIDVPHQYTKNLLGFAIQRKDEAGKETWLEGFRTFQEGSDKHQPGQLVSTENHPIQAFLWGDYAAKPGCKYTYKVIALYGTPEKMTKEQEVSVTVATENEDKGMHAVYFNRGAAGSQAYARKFQDKKPDEVPNGEAWKWLSRGLEEAMEGFIRQAKGAKYSIRAAVYEFSYAPLMKAFKEASESGADVKIVYDSRTKGPHVTSDKVIDEVGIRDLMIKRTSNPTYIAHNKFMILLEDGIPVQVWTGSTNFTAGGIFGQSNVGHIVRDKTVAKTYFDYWTELSQDPEAKELREFNLQLTPDVDTLPDSPSVTPIFSPRTSLNMLDWYGQMMENAKETVCMTAAFGVNQVFEKIYEEDKGYLRYLLLESKGKDLPELEQEKLNRVAFGATLDEATLDSKGLSSFLKESLTGLNTYVKYLHTKYMLVDPLGDNPIVISGSANFSNASTIDNDENMLIVQGDKRVADIYLGEFMRLFNHFYMRDIIKQQSSAEDKKMTYLTSDDSWCKLYYKEGTVQQKERLLFAQEVSVTA